VKSADALQVICGGPDFIEISGRPVLEACVDRRSTGTQMGGFVVSGLLACTRGRAGPLCAG
jgi:hypothetical protein